jgi:hypothetical protein
MNTTLQGSVLEIYAEHLFRDQGKLRVRRNILYEQVPLFRNPIKKEKQGKKIVAQIDVEYWDLMGKTIVECKHYPGGQVGIEEVVEFYVRGRIVEHDNSMMITTGTYPASSRKMGKKLGIKMVDREGLEKMDYERLSIMGMIKANMGKRPSLEQQLSNVSLRGYDTHQYSRQYKLLG